jgi:hypothetical protein
LRRRSWQEFAESVLAKAKEYGIDSERDMMRYASLGWVFGYRFDEVAPNLWIAETLRNPELAAGAKLDMVYSQVRAALRTQQKKSESTRTSAGLMS